MADQQTQRATDEAAAREQDPQAGPQLVVKVEKIESPGREDGKLTGPVVLANEKHGGEGDEDLASA